MNQFISYGLLSLVFLGSLSPSNAHAEPAGKVLAVAPGLDGVIEVTESMVVEYLRHSPDEELTVAVQTIVDTALLAQIARASGLETDTFVQERRREALAWVYLKNKFEPSYLTDAVPDSEGQRVYQANLSRFVHPEVIKADHIVIGVATQKSIKMPEDDALAAKAQTLLSALNDRLNANPPTSDSAFTSSAHSIKKDAEALGLVVRGESLGWYALEDGPFDRGFDRTFREASFAVPVGELSSVFASPFGWHLVRVSERKPAKNESYESVQSKVKLRILNEMRKRELEQLTARLAAKYPAISDREGILRLIQIEPVIRLDATRVLPKLEQ